MYTSYKSAGACKAALFTKCYLQQTYRVTGAVRLNVMIGGRDKIECHATNSMCWCSWSSFIKFDHLLLRLSFVFWVGLNFGNFRFVYIKIPRIFRLVLLIRIMLKWKWVWGRCGMILTGQNLRTGRKFCPSATLPPKNMTRTDLGTNPGSSYWKAIR